jgi:hypothetical protein
LHKKIPAIMSPNPIMGNKIKGGTMINIIPAAISMTFKNPKPLLPKYPPIKYPRFLIRLS